MSKLDKSITCKNQLRGLNVMLGSAKKVGQKKTKILAPNTQAYLWLSVQGTTVRLQPGLVIKKRKNCVALLAAGRRTHIYHLMFTKPDRSLYVVPCTVFLTSALLNEGAVQCKAVERRGIAPILPFTPSSQQSAAPWINCTLLTYLLIAAAAAVSDLVHPFDNVCISPKSFSLFRTLGEKEAQ